MKHPCIECAYYVAPNWWKKFKEGMFAERCAHPDHRDKVDGTPAPCVTMRVMDCDGENKFKPKGYDAAAHSAAYPGY